MRSRLLFLPCALISVVCLHAGAQSAVPGLAMRIPAQNLGQAPQDGFLQSSPPHLSPLTQNFSQPQNTVVMKPLLSQNEGLCYAMRTYRFKREAPGSEAMTPSGSSTCVPASGVREKSAGANAANRPSERPRIVAPTTVMGTPTRR